MKALGLGALTAGGAGSSVEIDTSPFLGGDCLFLLSPNAAGDGTVDLEHSDDGTSWSQLAQLVMANAGTPEYANVTITKRYLRVNCTTYVAGTIRTYLFGSNNGVYAHDFGPFAAGALTESASLECLTTPWTIGNRIVMVGSSVPLDGDGYLNYQSSPDDVNWTERFSFGITGGILGRDAMLDDLIRDRFIRVVDVGAGGTDGGIATGTLKMAFLTNPAGLSTFRLAQFVVTGGSANTPDLDMRESPWKHNQDVVAMLSWTASAGFTTGNVIELEGSHDATNWESLKTIVVDENGQRESFNLNISHRWMRALATGQDYPIGFGRIQLLGDAA